MTERGRAARLRDLQPRRAGRGEPPQPPLLALRRIRRHADRAHTGGVVVGGARHATSTERTPERWAELVERQGHGWVEQVPVSLAEQADEMLLMGLRLSEGIDLDRIAAASGQSPRAPVLAALVHDGLIERIAKHDVSPGQSSWPDEIKACVGPGMRPAVHVAPPFGHIRATKQGRFVLNEIVLRISASFIPVTVAPAAAASR